MKGMNRICRISKSGSENRPLIPSSLGEKLQVVYGTSRQTAVQPATGVLGTAAEARVEATRSVTSTTDYCGNIIYNGSSVSRILLDGKGYLTLSGSTPTYYFFMKDHLGNTRAVVNQSGTVKQEYQYYPFGKRWDDVYEYFKQPYQYNGKEMDEMHGLRWLDYGARMYEPALGRFMTMDPMAEKYYSVSPYAYCANNPVNAIDNKGDSIIIIIAPESAKGNGHLAMLIQKGEKQWGYFSKNGTRGVLPLYGESSYNSGDPTFPSGEDFLNSSFNKDKETGERNYIEGYLIPTTPEEDSNAIDAAVKELKKTYYILGSNCAEVIQKALEAADKNPGRPKSNFQLNKFGDNAVPILDYILKSKAPNKVYQQIKANNQGNIIK